MDVNWGDPWKAKPLEDVQDAINRIMCELGYTRPTTEKLQDPYQCYLEAERMAVERGVRKSVLENRGIR